MPVAGLQEVTTSLLTGMYGGVCMKEQPSFLVQNKSPHSSEETS